MLKYTHVWSAAQVDTLTRNWTDGLPLKRIMKLLAGISRNEILVKAHELGLGEHAGTHKATALARQRRGLEVARQVNNMQNRTDEQERQKLVRMPEVAWLKRRLPGEPEQGFWR